MENIDFWLCTKSSKDLVKHYLDDDNTKFSDTQQILIGRCLTKTLNKKMKPTPNLNNVIFAYTTDDI